MVVGVVDKLRFRESGLGYVRLSDDSVVILRVAIIDVRIRGEASPFGVDFDVSFTGGVSVYPSEKALREVMDKPVLEPGKSVGEGWVRVEIRDKSSAYEEAVYSDAKVGAYVIRVEIEPIMVSKNTMFRTVRSEPLYVVRWVPKVTWNRLENPSER